MKITPECVPCLLKRAVYEAELISSPYTDKAVIDAAKVLVEEYSPDKCSALIATKMHKAVYDAIKNNDPYKNLKDESNDAAFQIYNEAEKFIENSPDRLCASALVSVTGNIMDFGIAGTGGPKGLKSFFDKSLSEGLYVNDIKAAKKYFSSGIVFFTDNCGEIVFDKLFLKELRKHTPYLAVVVKGEAILTDATIADAKKYGLHEICDDVFTTGGFFIGFDFSCLPLELKEKMKGMLIISKGMANYEYLSDFDITPVLYMMRTKCRPVARSLSLPEKKNVAVLLD